MKMLIVLSMIATHSYAQQTTSDTNLRTGYNINDYQIDGVCASEKMNQAKQGIFNNIRYTAGGGSTSPECTSACDCIGTYEACISGSCQDISGKAPGGSCTASGQLVRGDSSCQYLCQGSLFVCPASGGPCGGGGKF